MAKGSKDAPTGHVEAEVYFTREQCIGMLKDCHYYASQLRQAAKHRGFDALGEPRIGLIATYLYHELGELEPHEMREVSPGHWISIHED